MRVKPHISDLHLRFQWIDSFALVLGVAHTTNIKT